MRADYRKLVMDRVVAGEAKVFTDRLASPTGFPFKIVESAGTISDAKVYADRPRICDLSYLREAYRTADGSIGYRCAAEPVTTYVAKGGDVAETVGRKCLCNALLAAIGHAQVRNGNRTEAAVITSGDDVAGNSRFLRAGATHYSAADVIEHLLGESVAAAVPARELVAVGV